jgi:NAD(P)-dependent dehydrogenase (short-subunit alcohol dehydrogenase family)
MARIFITGSTDGLGRAAAQALIERSHQVVLHARSPERAAALDDLAPRSAGVVIGDLSSATDTRNVANQVNALGRMDAVIHNAGAYSTKGRSPTPEGHPTIIAVNALAPYVLTSLMEPPGRLIYLSSGMHRSGSSSLRDIDLTQTWLAVSDDPAATVSGLYWHHRRLQNPAEQVEDPVFQDQLSARLAEMSGVSLF